MSKMFLCMMCVTTALGAAADAGLLPEQEAVLRAFARGEATPEWTPLTPAQARAIHDRSEAYWDLFHKHHLPHGLYADVWWTDRERSAVYKLEGLGDSACWHGHYVAALVFRHKVTGEDWVLDEIRKNLDRYDLLTRISGRDGYVARYAGPVDDEGYKPYYSVYGRGEDPERPGFGLRAWRGVPPWEDLAWLGYSSRDTYDGTLFALATVWANTDDQQARDKVKDIAERVGDRLIEDNWTIPDGKGNVTPGNAMFNMGYMRLLMAVNPDKYAGLREDCLKITRALAERPDIYPMDFGDYFANNLRFIRMYNNCMLESDPEQKALLQGAMRTMAEKALTHLNPHFSALTLLAAGTDDPRHVAMVQGMLADFPDPPKFGRRVEADPSLEMADAKHARFALLTRERIPGDFLWRMSPNQAVNDFPADVDSFEYPGADMFLPYWAGRLAGALPAP